MKINIHGGFKKTMNALMLSLTIPIMIMFIILITLEDSTPQEIVSFVIVIIILCLINFLVMRYIKPRAGGFDKKIYYYLQKKDENTVILIDDNGEEEIVYNVKYIIYFTSIFNFLLLLDYLMPKNIKIVYMEDEKEIEKEIGSITKRELKKIKGMGIFYIKKKGELVEY